jgi:hypothetical protein
MHDLSGRTSLVITWDRIAFDQLLQLQNQKDQLKDKLLEMVKWRPTWGTPVPVNIHPSLLNTRLVKWEKLLCLAPALPMRVSSGWTLSLADPFSTPFHRRQGLPVKQRGIGREGHAYTRVGRGVSWSMAVFLGFELGLFGTRTTRRCLRLGRRSGTGGRQVMAASCGVSSGCTSGRSLGPWPGRELDPLVILGHFQRVDAFQMPKMSTRVGLRRSAYTKLVVRAFASGVAPAAWCISGVGYLFFRNFRKHVKQSNCTNI